MTDFMREVLPIVLAAGIATPLGMLAMWAIERWWREDR